MYVHIQLHGHISGIYAATLLAQVSARFSLGGFSSIFYMFCLQMYCQAVNV